MEEIEKNHQRLLAPPSLDITFPSINIIEPLTTQQDTSINLADSAHLTTSKPEMQGNKSVDCEDHLNQSVSRMHRHVSMRYGM